MLLIRQGHRTKIAVPPKSSGAKLSAEEYFSPGGMEWACW